MLHRHLPAKAILVRQGGKGGGKGVLVKIKAGQRPLESHEKQAQHRVLMLVGMQDVSPMFEDEACDGKDQALAIFTIEQQCGAG